MSPVTKQNLKIIIAVITTAIVVLILFRKKEPLIEYEESPIKTMYNYNIPPLGDFIYTGGNYDIPCGCKSKTTPAKESKKTELDVSKFVTNMSGYTS